MPNNAVTVREKEDKEGNPKFVATVTLRQEFSSRAMAEEWANRKLSD